MWFGRAEELLGGTLKDELAEADSPDGQLARLRPGAGDWRTGWFASYLGELFVRGPDWIFKPPGSFLDAEGRRQRLRYEDNNLLPTSRAMRMAASADGRRVAFGWLGFAKNVPGLPTHTDAVSVWQVNPNQRLWSAPPTVGTPAARCPTRCRTFRIWRRTSVWRADALVPGHVAAAVALNRDGSRVAVVEYGVSVLGAKRTGHWQVGPADSRVELLAQAAWPIARVRRGGQGVVERAAAGGRDV